MKLYIYEHCPYCIRTQMIFGFKNIDYDLKILMEADIETPTQMIGKKMAPILEKDDGSYMPESLDIVKYVDAINGPMIDLQQDPEILSWLEQAKGLIYNLSIPRFTKADLKELATDEAREYFKSRMVKSFGDFDEHIANTSQYLKELAPLLQDLDSKLAARNAKGKPSINDILLWPLLCALTVVKDIHFPQHVKSYIEEISTQSKTPCFTNRAL